MDTSSVDFEQMATSQGATSSGEVSASRAAAATVAPDALPVPMLLLSKDGATVLEANAAARTMFGRRTADITKFLDSNLPTDVRIRLIGACAGVETLSCYPLELRPRGRRVRLQLNIVPASGEYVKTAVWLVLQDVTDAFDADLWQVRYQTLAQALFSELPYPGWLLDGDNKLLFHNRAYQDLPDCLRGPSMSTSGVEADSSCSCRKSDYAGSLVSKPDWRGLAEQVRRSGRMEQKELHLGECGRWQLLMFPLPGNLEGLHVGVIAMQRALTETITLAPYEPSLGSIAQGLLEVRQQERGAIAREIHDNLGQEITLLLLEIERVLSMNRRLANGDEQLQEKLTDVYEHARHIMQAARRLAYQMRQVTVDSNGLGAAAAEFVVSYRRRSGLQGQLEVMEGWQEPGVEMAQHLFRSLQELLNNVAKHSGATRFAVAMGVDGEGYWLEVQDNGHGLPRKVQEGAGLRSLRERAAIYGGRIEVFTNPAIRGTKVRVVLPIAVGHG